LGAALDQELARLPERYRAPLVLCYLEGKAQDEAARLLGWARSTVQHRLARGRNLLRARLERRGVALGTGLLATALAQGATTGAVSPILVQTTVKAALAFGAGEVLAKSVSAQSVLLAKGALQTMFVTKMNLVAVGMVAVSLLGVGAGVLTHHALAGKQVAEERAEPVQPATQVAETPKRVEKLPAPADRNGDPLPAGAVARLGTVRFNHGDGLRNLFFTPAGKTVLSEGNGLIHLWEAATGKELRRFAATDYPFYSQMVLSPDGKTLISLYQEGAGHDTARFWDVAQGKEVRVLPLPLPARRKSWSHDCANALAPDGSLAAVHTPERIEVFDLATGRQLYQLPRMGKEIPAVSFAGRERLLTADRGQTIEVWEGHTGKLLRRITPGLPLADFGWGPPLVASADGRWLATLERQTRPFPLPDGTRLPLHERDVIHIWDLDTGTRKQVLTARPNRWHFHLRFSPDGKLLFASNTGDQEQEFHELTVWDVATGQRVRALAGACGRPLEASPDGTLLAEGDWYSKFNLWDLKTGRCLTGEDDRHAQTETLLLPSAGERLLTFGQASVNTWDVATGRRLRSLDVPRHPYGDPGRSHFFSPDGRYAATFHLNDGLVEILLWDVASGRQLHTLRLPGSPQYMPSDVTNVTRVFDPRPVACAFSPDASVLATCQEDKGVVVRLWDIQTGKELRSFPVAEVGRLFFTADGKTLLVAGLRTRGFEVPSGKEIFSWQPERLKSKYTTQVVIRGRVMDNNDWPSWRALAVSPQGTLVAYILAKEVGVGERVEEDRIVLCDARTGKIVRRWSDSGKPGRLLEQVGFSPDGRLLATSDGVLIHLWEVATGKEVHTLQGHQGEICALAFSADGRRLASSSLDSTVLLWNLAVGTPSGGQDVAAWWADLASADARRGYAAVWRLAAAPEAAVPWVGQHLRPVTGAQMKEIRRLIVDLDSETFAVRDQAFAKLKGRIQDAAPELRRVLEKKVSLELRRRVEALLETLENQPLSGEPLRSLRALMALEYAGTAAARQLLRALADGAPEARLTQEAKASLDRLARRSAGKP
jgi:WD40 repeat protein